MKKKRYRVNKARQDQLIEKAVDDLLSPESFIRDLPPQQILETLNRLVLEALRDYQEILDKKGAPSEDYPDPAEMWQRAHHLSQCAWDHFRHQASDRFRLTLIELINESLAFAESIYLERSGASEDEIRDARPTPADIQHNVLRHSVTTLNHLPLRRDSNDWQVVELDDNLSPVQLQVARTIFKDLPLWTYDHMKVCEIVQKMIRPYLEKHEDPDEEAKLWGSETAELIWENIDGGTQIMLLILTNWALLLSKQSAVKRYEVEIDQKEARQIQHSKEKLKDIANTLIGSWIDSLPFEWRGSGRPAKTSTQIAVDRERLITELRDIMKELAEDDHITWEKLASHRDRPVNNPQSGDSLRKEAAALGIHLSDLKPEEN